MFGLDRLIANFDARNRAKAAKQFEAQARKQGGKPSVRHSTNETPVKMRRGK